MPPSVAEVNLVNKCLSLHYYKMNEYEQYTGTDLYKKLRTD